MITLLTGSNSFAIAREIQRREAAFGGPAEKVEGRAVEMESLGQLVAGATLFAERRLVVVDELSDNSTVWQALPDWISQASSDVELLLVEPAPDRRTKAYKTLQKAAEVIDIPLLTERDSVKAERWLMDEAKQLNITLEAPAARLLIQRSLVMPEKGQPVIDQWLAMSMLEKLSVFDPITAAEVEEYTDRQPVESVFTIFETALRGDRIKLRSLLHVLEASEEPHKVLGLLVSQVFSLVALINSGVSSAEVAKSIGVHPFTVSKLEPFARKLTKQGVAQMVQALTTADNAMKLSKAEPWVLIEQALMKIALLANKNSA